MVFKLEGGILYPIYNIILIVCTISIFNFCSGASVDERYLDEMSCASNLQITLKKHETLIIKLSRSTNREKNFYEFQCQFSVLGFWSQDVMTVVQGLNLRTRWPSCEDSIHFEDARGHQTGPICGNFAKENHDEYPKGLVGPRAFRADDGLVVTVKFGGYNEREPFHEPFQLELSFTLLTVCTAAEALMRPARQCSTTYCVSQKLICDGIINCGLPGKFGLDELNCNQNEVKNIGSRMNKTEQKQPETNYFWGFIEAFKDFATLGPAPKSQLETSSSSTLRVEPTRKSQVEMSSTTRPEPASKVRLLTSTPQPEPTAKFLLVTTYTPRLEPTPKFPLVPSSTVGAETTPKSQLIILPTPHPEPTTPKSQLIIVPSPLPEPTPKSQLIILPAPHTEPTTPKSKLIIVPSPLPDPMPKSQLVTRSTSRPEPTPHSQLIISTTSRAVSTSVFNKTTHIPKAALIGDSYLKLSNNTRIPAKISLNNALETAPKLRHSLTPPTPESDNLQRPPLQVDEANGKENESQNLATMPAEYDMSFPGIKFHIPVLVFGFISAIAGGVLVLLFSVIFCCLVLNFRERKLNRENFTQGPSEFNTANKTPMQYIESIIRSGEHNVYSSPDYVSAL